MKPFLKGLFSLLFLAVLTFGAAGEAHALFDLQVSPRKGGQTIRFEESMPGKLLENEEVALTVTNTTGIQYNVYQTIYQPLTNEFGNTIPAGKFIEFSSSNPTGTLRTQQETPVSMGQTPVYTSNAAGDSIQFILVFNVRVPEDQPGGRYRTSITFTADPLTPTVGASPSVVTLDVTVELRPTFKIEIRSAKGGQDELNLGRISQNNLTAKAALRVKIESNIGTTYRISQQLTDPLSTAEGESIDESDIQFTAVGARSGRAEINQAEPLGASSRVIYTSDASGQGDAFDVVFQATPEDTQKAGVYTGTLTFKVESNSPLVSSEVVTIQIRLEIEPIFYLDVEMKNGAALHFGTFKTDTGEQSQTALVTVHSNLGEPYTIAQTVRKFTAEQGNTLSQDRFRYFGVDAKTGSLSAVSPTPTSDAETVIFKSDAKGTPEKFVLNYLLSVPVDALGGSYNSDIKYSLTTL